MSLERAAAWVRKHYTWPVVFVMIALTFFVPRSYTVVGVIAVTAMLVLLLDLGRKIGRGFREGYRGRE